MATVVVPTVNEAENLPELLRRLAAAGVGEVVVVDDGSTDGTPEVALSVGRQVGMEVKVVRRPRRMGISSAAVEGARAASHDVVVVMDADLQHPPELVPRLAQEAAGGCVAVASRYVEGGAVVGWPPVRRLISRGAVLLARLLLPEARPVRDPVSGFFAAPRPCLASVRPTGLYKVLLDVLVQCRPACVKEVPYAFGRRHRGRSKLGVRHMADYIFQLLRLARWRPLKFAAVGASGIAVAEAVLWALSVVPALLSTAAAIEASLTWNYLLNRAWTFRGRQVPPLAGWARYHLATAVGNAANYAVTNALHHLAGLPLYAAYLFGVAVGFAVNYAMSEGYAFAAPRPAGG